MNEKTIVLTLEILFILAICLLISSFRNPAMGSGDPFAEEQSSTASDYAIQELTPDITTCTTAQP